MYGLHVCTARDNVYLTYAGFRIFVGGYGKDQHFIPHCRAGFDTGYPRAAVLGNLDAVVQISRQWNGYCSSFRSNRIIGAVYNYLPFRNYYRPQQGAHFSVGDENQHFTRNLSVGGGDLYISRTDVGHVYGSG